MRAYDTPLFERIGAGDQGLGPAVAPFIAILGEFRVETDASDDYEKDDRRDKRQRNHERSTPKYSPQMNERAATTTIATIPGLVNASRLNNASSGAKTMRRTPASRMASPVICRICVLVLTETD